MPNKSATYYVTKNYIAAIEQTFYRGEGDYDLLFKNTKRWGEFKSKPLKSYKGHCTYYHIKEFQEYIKNQLEDYGILVEIQPDGINTFILHKSMITTHFYNTKREIINNFLDTIIL